MKIGINRLVKYLIFVLALASSVFPRPLDFHFLAYAIVLFVVVNFERIPQLFRENIKTKYFFGFFILFFSFFSIIHDFSRVLEALTNDGIMTFVPAFLFFTLLFATADETDKKPILFVFYTTVALISTISILQFAGFLNNSKTSIAEMFLYAPIYRSTAFFPHTTANTIWLMCANLVLLFIPLTSSRQLLIHSAVSILSVFALSATQGRAGFLILLITVVLTIFSEISTALIRNSIIRTYFKPVGLIFSTLIVVLAISLLNPKGSGNRFSEFLDAKSKHNQRLQEIAVGAEILFKYPLGLGPIKISDDGRAVDIEPLFQRDKSRVVSEWHGIHNGYLHYASMLGWAGLFFMVICLFIPTFLIQKRMTTYVISLCLGIYFLTDNIFYREISSILAFAFLAVNYFNRILSSSSHQNLEVKSVNRMKFFLFIVYLLLSLFLVPLRTFQIQNSNVVSITIDNFSLSTVQLLLNQKMVKIVEPNDNGAVFIKAGSEMEIALKSNDNEQKIRLDFTNFRKNHSGLWLTTDPKENFYFLFSKDDMKGYFIIPFDKYTLGVEQTTADVKEFLFKPDFSSALIRDELINDSKFRCFEPSRFDVKSGVYANPCLIGSYRNYKLDAIKQVFGR